MQTTCEHCLQGSAQGHCCDHGIIMRCWSMLVLSVLSSSPFSSRPKALKPHNGQANRDPPSLSSCCLGYGMPWDATRDPTASTKVTKVSPAFSRIGKKMQQRSTKIQLSCNGIDFWIHDVVTTWTLESCGTLAVTKQKVSLHIASLHMSFTYSQYGLSSCRAKKATIAWMHSETGSLQEI